MLIDSNIIIAYCNKNDSQHQKAVNVLDTLFQQGVYFYITPFVYSEIITILNIRTNYDFSKHIAQYIINTKQFIFLEYDDETFQMTIKRFCDKKTKLSFVDTHIIETAQKHQLKIHTFDQELQKEISKFID